MVEAKRSRFCCKNVTNSQSLYLAPIHRKHTGLSQHRKHLSDLKKTFLRYRHSEHTLSLLTTTSSHSAGPASTGEKFGSARSRSGPAFAGGRAPVAAPCYPVSATTTATCPPDPANHPTLVGADALCLISYFVCFMFTHMIYSICSWS